MGHHLPRTPITHIIGLEVSGLWSSPRGTTNPNHSSSDVTASDPRLSVATLRRHAAVVFGVAVVSHATDARKPGVLLGPRVVAIDLRGGRRRRPISPKAAKPPASMLRPLPKGYQQ
ncbi:hypothetical protein VTN02DRAFT_3623 [Thermoascus thermophilus]